MIARIAADKLEDSHENEQIILLAGQAADLATAVLRRISGSVGGDKIDECRVLRDVIPPTPPDPEGSNGNGLVRAQ